MLAGMLVMLDANLPLPKGRNRTWLALQALAGFALVLGGWWLRRRATRRQENDE